MQPLQTLSHKQRELTPPRFARYLVNRVRELTGSYTVVALFCHADSPYKHIEGVECYDLARDAFTYDGPYPVVAHPPCGPWGQLAQFCKHQTRDGGIFAMATVHRVGGVVEQPRSSRLFRMYGEFGGSIETLNQYKFGHCALKPTALYFFLCQDTR